MNVSMQLLVTIKGKILQQKDPLLRYINDYVYFENRYIGKKR
jgi:hypothetical protein